MSWLCVHQVVQGVHEEIISLLILHSVYFIRDTKILRLVLSLIFSKILTSTVPYLSLIFFAKFVLFGLKNKFHKVSKELFDKGSKNNTGQIVTKS